MRVALIGVSNWHMPFCLEPCVNMPDVSIVGVSHVDLSRVEPAAAEAGFRAFAEYREICAMVRPDFAFALTRVNLADNAASRALVEAAYRLSPLTADVA